MGALLLPFSTGCSVSWELLASQEALLSFLNSPLAAGTSYLIYGGQVILLSRHHPDPPDLLLLQPLPSLRYIEPLWQHHPSFGSFLDLFLLFYYYCPGRPSIGPSLFLFFGRYLPGADSHLTLLSPDHCWSPPLTRPIESVPC